MRTEFRLIFSLAALTGCKCVIAGGAAVNFEKASDVDVFVLDGDAQRLAVAIDSDASGVVRPSSMYPARFEILANCRASWSKKPIQVIQYPGCKTAETLLQSFDLSVHQWAITPTGDRIRVKTSTRPQEPIRIVNSNRSTQRRLVRLWQRYFMSRFFGVEGMQGA